MSAGAALISLLVVGTLVVTTGVERGTDSPRDVHAGTRPLAWSDEFQGPRGSHPNRRKWTFETGYGWGDRELQSYTARRANASLDGKGHLAIRARRERYTGADRRTAHYTSARMNSRTRFEFAYGRVEARIRVPRGRGLLPAFWALGTDVDRVGWPAAGEIDLMEVHGGRPFTVHGTLHGPRAGGGDYALAAMRRSRVPLTSGFHVYGVSWHPGRIVFRLDGEVYAVRTRSHLSDSSRWRFDHPFSLLFTLAVGPRWLGRPDATTRFPATMLIDWVRVRLGRTTFCPTIRAPRLRPRCPRHPRAAPARRESAQ
jgi:beta-glucanase (GH16 family)